MPLGESYPGLEAGTEEDKPLDHIFLTRSTWTQSNSWNWMGKFHIFIFISSNLGVALLTIMNVVSEFRNTKAFHLKLS